MILTITDIEKKIFVLSELGKGQCAILRRLFQRIVEKVR